MFACLFLLSDPDKVYNLAVSNNTDNSFLVTWTRPQGSFNDILVEVYSPGIKYVFADGQQHCIHIHT